MTNHFGEQLRALRVARGLTLEDVGRACGVQRAAVSKWELGLVPVPTRHLNAISGLLETDLRIVASEVDAQVQRLADLAAAMDPNDLANLIAIAEAIVKKK